MLPIPARLAVVDDLSLVTARYLTVASVRLKMVASIPNDYAKKDQWRISTTSKSISSHSNPSQEDVENLKAVAGAQEKLNVVVDD